MIENAIMLPSIVPFFRGNIKGGAGGWGGLGLKYELYSDASQLSIS